jgi:hypothetical protein
LFTRQDELRIVQGYQLTKCGLFRCRPAAMVAAQAGKLQFRSLP